MKITLITLNRITWIVEELGEVDLPVVPEKGSGITYKTKFYIVDQANYDTLNNSITLMVSP